LILGLAGAGALLGGAPLAAPAIEDPAGRATYRRPLAHDPQTLDPARISDVYSRSVSEQIFDGLIQFDQTLALAPALAQFWKASRDGLTWTFTLRKGVKFHNGAELSADDVVYSLTRLLDPKTRSGAADLFLNIRGARDFRDGKARQVAGLVAVDRHTVRIELEDAPAPFVSLLAVGHAKIVPREVVERQGDGFGLQPIGTGPFRFERWDRGRQIVLAANRDYFDGPPRLARVVYQVFPGDQREEMFAEFEKGRLEDAPVPTRDYAHVIASPAHVYVKRPMISVRFYGMNTRVPPLDDRRVRQALIHAINRDALVETVHAGRYTVARGILPPRVQGFNPKLRAYAYDPQKARELLAQAGYRGGREFPRLQIWSSVQRDAVVQEHQRIKEDLAHVGVPVEFQYVSNWPAFAKLVDERKTPIFLYAWYADVPDPDNFLFKLFYSRSPRNLFGYANPAVDDLLVRARTEHDLPRRTELYRKAEQLILDDAPVIPVFHHNYERLFQPYVRSVEVNGLGDPYIPLRKIWLERPE
jgi:peptide/nickel transport system substrate-binding protein/oligopeptide transport system substrate-binding protein